MTVFMYENRDFLRGRFIGIYNTAARSLKDLPGYSWVEMKRGTTRLVSDVSNVTRAPVQYRWWYVGLAVEGGLDAGMFVRATNVVTALNRLDEVTGVKVSEEQTRNGRAVTVIGPLPIRDFATKVHPAWQEVLLTAEAVRTIWIELLT